MKMPGFTAEASFHKGSKHHYSAAALSTLKGSQKVMPQHMTPIPVPGTGCFCLGKPDNVWTGPIFHDGFCTLEFIPVHDARGNTYGNPCDAAREGIRETWNGEGHALPFPLGIPPGPPRPSPL